MAIEFPCPSCNTLIRTPEGTEGKPARCPQCSTIVVVPSGGATFPGAASPRTTPPAVGQTAADMPTKAPEGNPFADKPAAALNPYAAPANPFARDPFQPLSAAELDQRARSRLMAPAILMIIFAVTGLGFMALVALGLTLDPNLFARDVGQQPAERAGAIGFFAAYFTVGFLTRVLQIFGAIAMLRRRGYGLAMTGAVCALIPCEVYCFLPSFPFGIWALIVLNNAEVKAAFGR